MSGWAAVNVPNIIQTAKANEQSTTVLIIDCGDPLKHKYALKYQ